MITQSKLSLQLSKETNINQKHSIDEDKIDDLYQILTKMENKNLMLVEFLIFLIEKGFVKNSQKIQTFIDIYDEVKAADSEAKSKTDEEEKFTKDKFIEALKIIAQKIYPGETNSFEKIIYPRITSTESAEEVRLRIDENVRKMINRQILAIWKEHQKQFQTIFEVYLPENFNNNMGFTWKEIRYLQKKLPIIAVFRMLWECQIIPHFITPGHFLESASRILPPQSHINGSNQKQALFYSPEGIINYSKETVNFKEIKLMEGDIGVTLFDFQILLTKLATDITKDKSEPTKALTTLLTNMKLKQGINSRGESKVKSTKMQETLKRFFAAEGKKNNKNNLQLQKRETKKKIEQILEVNQNMENNKTNQFRESKITVAQLYEIKRSLDEDRLPIVGLPTPKEKENNSNYSVDEKHIVIGEQLPKIQDKNKAAAPNKNQKKDGAENLYKFEDAKQENNSEDHFRQILKKPFKQRRNQEFPIILTEAIYPHNIPNLPIPPKAQLNLETAYIQLGEKSHEQAFLNFNKAKSVCQSMKNPLLEYFFTILEAQIYQAAGRDSIALKIYHKARQLSLNNPSKDVLLKYFSYRGLGNTLYHLEEYQYALRCFLKVKDLTQTLSSEKSLENAIIENNIGCCFMILNRNNQACDHFRLAHSILDLELGRFHEHTLIAETNIRKNKKAVIQGSPGFSTMWRTYMEKPGAAKDAKGGKGKGK